MCDRSKVETCKFHAKIWDQSKGEHFQGQSDEEHFCDQIKISDNDHTETDSDLLATTIDAAFAVIKN